MLLTNKLLFKDIIYLLWDEITLIDHDGNCILDYQPKTSDYDLIIKLLDILRYYY